MKLRLVSRVIVLALALLVGTIIVVRDHLAASHPAPQRAVPQGVYLATDAGLAFTPSTLVPNLDRSVL
jgi:hypothetical protein